MNTNTSLVLIAALLLFVIAGTHLFDRFIVFKTKGQSETLAVTSKPAAMRVVAVGNIIPPFKPRIIIKHDTVITEKQILDTLMRIDSITFGEHGIDDVVATKDDTLESERHKVFVRLEFSRKYQSFKNSLLHVVDKAKHEAVVTQNTFFDDLWYYAKIIFIAIGSAWVGYEIGKR